MLALEGLEGLVIIDEIQLRPDLFPILRVLADRKPLPCRFLILGSASPDIVKGVSESLAGRVHSINVSGLNLDEAGPSDQKRLWLRGGFPESLSRLKRPRRIQVARRLYPHLPATGPTAARNTNTRRADAALLGHARLLSRKQLECIGNLPIPRSQKQNDPPLRRHPRWSVHGSSTSTLVGKHR